MPQKSTGLLAALLSCLLVITWAGMDLKLHRDEAKSRTRAQLESRTRLVSEWVKGAYLAADLRLQDIVEEMQADELRYPTKAPEQHQERTQWLRHKLANLPGAYFIGAANRDCVVTHHTNPAVRLGLDVSQRDYCRALRQDDGPDAIITPLYTTSFGQLTVTLARRVRDTNGRVAGLVVIGMDMSLFSGFLRGIPLAPGEALALVDQRLNLIARNPPMEVLDGRDSLPDVTKDFAASLQTTAFQHEVSPIDGVRRLAMLRKIEGTPMVIVASETDARWLEGWYQRIWEVGAACLGLFVLVGLLLLIQSRAVASSERLQLAIDVSQLGFWSQNLVSGQVTWSDPVYAHFGLSPGQSVTSEVMKRLIHPDDMARVRAEIASAIDRRADFDLEYRVVRADGSMRWLRSVGRPYFRDDGVPLRLDGTTQDISEQKALQRAREDAKAADFMLKQQVAAQTVAQIAHELNQPLQAISLANEVATDLVQKTGALDIRLHDVLNHSHEQAQRAGKVLTQLMDQIHAWRDGEHRASPFDLNEVVRKVTQEALAVHPHVQIVLKLDRALPQVHGLPLQTEKVLGNLIGNAIESMETARMPRPHLTLRTSLRPESNHVWISVRDYGPGMDAATASQVFDPFFSTKPRGMGLGLGICRALIHIQGGEIWVDRDCQPGSEFHFTLPAASGRSADFRPAASA